MNSILRWIVALGVLFCWIGLSAAYASDPGQKVKVRGLITDRTGDTLTVKTADGNVTVLLTDETKAQKPKGLGIRKAQMSFAALMPGLRVTVEGVRDDQSRVVASTITFSGDDLQTAETIQAGLTPTQQTVQANQQNIAANKERIETNEQEIEAVSKRFSDLTEFDTKAETTVYFASGSKTISAKDKTSLMDLARTAVNLTGYIIQVKGFADTSGNAAMNQKLSMDRAQEVVAFLIQNCNVPVRRVVAPGAMGTADPAAPNETSKGRAANRRVEVKVLVNRGLAGGH
jgi:OOP family OmpA-OmpF porin